MLLHFFAHGAHGLDLVHFCILANVAGVLLQGSVVAPATCVAHFTATAAGKEGLVIQGKAEGPMKKVKTPSDYNA